MIFSITLQENFMLFEKYVGLINALLKNVFFHLKLEPHGQILFPKGKSLPYFFSNFFL